MKKPLPIILSLLIIFTAFCLWNTKDGTRSPAVQSEGNSQGEAAIGGDFDLIGQTGEVVHDADFRGRLMLVTFGFTHCPDICPITAATMSKALDIVGENAKVTGLFISIDPERDSPAALKDFLASFNPHLTGLTGTAEQIKAVTLAYKAYFAKQGAPWTDDKNPPPDENYVVDHSSFIYLMDTNGKYITHFPYNAKPEDIADAITSHLPK